MSSLPRLDRDAIKKIAREHAPSYLLYNPAPEWFSEMYNGTVYYFPPDLDGRDVKHPVTGAVVPADGTLRVKNRYGIIYGSRGVAAYGYGLPVVDSDGQIENETADKIVQFFTTKFGAEANDPIMRLGITLLTGDPIIDLDIKKTSRQMWRAANKAWAEAERQKRLEDLEKWKRSNPGRTDYPPMNARQRRAEEILLAAEEDRVVDHLKFVCPEGDYETDDEARFERHIQMRHPDLFAKREKEKALPPFPVKRPRGRPRKYPLHPPNPVGTPLT
jgi:hypothetical protein